MFSRFEKTEDDNSAEVRRQDLITWTERITRSGNEAAPSTLKRLRGVSAYEPVPPRHVQKGIGDSGILEVENTTNFASHEQHVLGAEVAVVDYGGFGARGVLRRLPPSPRQPSLTPCGVRACSQPSAAATSSS